MTAFRDGKAVSQVDFILCEGEMYSLVDIAYIIRKYEVKPVSKKKS